MCCGLWLYIFSFYLPLTIFCFLICSSSSFNLWSCRNVCSSFLFFNGGQTSLESDAGVINDWEEDLLCLEDMNENNDAVSVWHISCIKGFSSILSHFFIFGFHYSIHLCVCLLLFLGSFDSNLGVCCFLKSPFRGLWVARGLLALCFLLDAFLFFVCCSVVWWGQNGSFANTSTLFTNEHLILCLKYSDCKLRLDHTAWIQHYFSWILY